MSHLIVFGAGKIAEVAHYYLTNDSPHEIVAFTVNEDFITKKRLFGLPVIAFEEIGIPARTVELSKDGCINTDVDLGRVFDVL